MPPHPPPAAEQRSEPWQVLFLGTSSGQPTLARGLSCVALQRDGALYLLDCGEAAQMQFRRAGLRFGRIAAILITHMHGDHVTGLPGMLMSLQMSGRTEPLPLVGPPELRTYVLETARLIATGFSFELQFVDVTAQERVLETRDLVVTTRLLEHRLAAYGYRFTEKDAPGVFDVEAASRAGIKPGPDYGRLQRGEAVAGPDGALVAPLGIVGPPRRGRSIAYCTDTRPCRGSVELAYEADVLIHEATFMSDRADDARDTGHSTAAQAASVARDARVQRLLLTHFSPRYTDIGPLLAEARTVFEASEAAEDLAQFSL
jgi:ribonuclease Z